MSSRPRSTKHLLPNCRPANAKELERILRKDFAFTGPIAAITKRQVLDQIDRIQAPSAANHATVSIKMLFNWEEDLGHIDVNPIAKLRKPYAEKSRSRALTLLELPQFWRAAGELGQFGLIFRLAILTGQRKNNWPLRTNSGCAKSISSSRLAAGEGALLLGSNRAR